MTARTIPGDLLHRTKVIDGLRQAADFLAAHPDLPVAPYGWDLNIYTGHRDGEAAARAQVDHIARVLATIHLERHRARQDEERRLLGAAWQDYGLVFASSVGTPLEPRNVNRRWDELRERAGLHWLRLHDLRHGCATFMLAAGVPARTIMDVLGHSEIGVTMNTSTHVLMQLREDAADAIDGVLGG
jgi:integrase